MGLFSTIIVKGVTTAATKSIIKTVGNTTLDVIAATAQQQALKDDAVEKNGRLYIRPPRSSEDYLGENAFEVLQELTGAGFENVTLKPIKKLSNRATKKYGNIESISINGNNEFLGVKRVPATSYIVIEFLDYKEDIDHTTYASVNPIKAGLMQSISNFEETFQKNPIKHLSKSFCPYCGEKVLNEKSRFCTACGKEL